MDLASRKSREIRGTPDVKSTLQTYGGLINGSTAGDQRVPRYDHLRLTFHLTGRDVQLVRNEST
jgi:hypothetical protein